jgi:hypothetical protein
MEMKLGQPTEIAIKPNPGKTEFRFLLSFPGSPQSVEFLTSARGAMLLMQGLQVVQATHKIPIPRRRVPAGKPNLRIVTGDDE